MTASHDAHKYDLAVYCRTCRKRDVVEDFLPQPNPALVLVQNCRRCCQKHGARPVVNLRQFKLKHVIEQNREKYARLMNREIEHRRIKVDCEQCGSSYPLTPEYLEDPELKTCPDCRGGSTTEEGVQQPSRMSAGSPHPTNGPSRSGRKEQA